MSGHDFFFCRGAIAAGLGIGMLPWFMARPEIEAGRMVCVLPDYGVSFGTLFVVYPPAKPLSPKVEAFTSYMRAHIPRLLGS